MSSDSLKHSSRAVAAEWIADSEVPQRLKLIYRYWRSKGFTAIVLSKFLTLLGVAFMLALVFTLALCINYHILFTAYSIPEALHRPVVTTTGQGIFMVFFAVFLLYWFYRFIDFFRVAFKYRKIKRYLAWLQINDEDIKTLTWEEVLDRVVENQKSSLRRGTHLTHLDIVNLIMMQDNYMIALVNLGKLDLSLPFSPLACWCPFSCCGTTACQQPPQKQQHMSKIMEWILRRTLFSIAFSGRGNALCEELCSDYTSPQTITDLSNRLKRRFRIFGIIGFLASPFILAWLFMYFTFKYGDQVKNDPGKILVTREWSPYACWKFRDFNELPHDLSDRLAHAHKPASNYVDSFHGHISGIIARFLLFVLGSIAFVLVLAGIYDEQFLLHAELFGRSLLILLGFIATAMAIARQLVPEEHFVFEPNKYLAELTVYIHYCPDHWVNNSGTTPSSDRRIPITEQEANRLNGHKPDVYKEVTEFFQYKFLMWLNEASAVILAPIIVTFTLTRYSHDLLSFFRDYTVEVNNFNVCRFAAFDLKLKNPQYAPTAAGTHSASLTTTTSSSRTLSDDSHNLSDTQTIPKTEIVEERKRRKRHDPENPFRLYSAPTEGSSFRELPVHTPRSNRPLWDATLNRRQDLQPSNNGKLEMSILAFSSRYPKWAADDDDYERHQFVNNAKEKVAISTSQPLRYSAKILSSAPLPAPPRDVRLQVDENEKALVQTILSLSGSTDCLRRSDSQNG